VIELKNTIDSVVDKDVLFPSNENGSYDEQLRRNNRVPVFRLKGSTAKQAVLTTVREVRKGEWWVLTGVLAILPIDSLPNSCIFARQLTDKVWVFPQACYTSDIESILTTHNRDVEFCEYEILYSARYVDYSDRETANMKLHSSGYVECMRTIAANSTEVVIYSNIVDNKGKVERKQVHKFSLCVAFFASQISLQINQLVDNQKESIGERLSLDLAIIMTLKRYLYYNKNSIANINNLLITVNDELNKLDDYIPNEYKDKSNQIYNSLKLYIELILKLVFPLLSFSIDYTERDLYPVVRYNSFIKTPPELTVIDYYSFFESVREKYAHSAKNVLNLRDYLATRVNKFMSNSFFVILDNAAMLDFRGYVNFGSDFEYINQLHTIQMYIAAKKQVTFCFYLLIKF
jgi:hypothetical protein